MIGGDFNSVSGISKHRIARLKLCLEGTVWNGVEWSNGYPSGGKEIYFKEDYPSLTTANVCSCSIELGKTVTLLSKNTLGIEFSYSGLGTLVLEDSANIYQSDDDIVNTGLIHLKRKSAPILRLDYTYWSSPVNSQKLFDVSPNTAGNKFYSYNYGWQGESPSNSMVVGKGYIIRGPESFSSTVPEIYETIFKGIPNNGVVKANVSRLNIIDLIGNPYPSTLDADLFLYQNRSKIKGMVYFWTHNTPLTNINNKYTADDYAVYNRLGGVGTRPALTSGLNENIPDGKIGSGQAFFVRSLGEGTIEINNSMRTPETNSLFFKPAKINKEKQSNQFEKHRIWLNIQNKEGMFKQILIGYIKGASNFYDSDFDAEAINGSQFVDLYSIVENKRLVIQGRGLPFEETDSIPLGYTSTIDGELNISIDHEDGLFDNTPVYIVDKDLKIMHNLKEGPYSFVTQKGTFEDRFRLSFVEENLKTDIWTADANKIIVSVNKKNILIDANQNTIKDITIFDISGKQIYKKINTANSKFLVENLPIKDQMLLIKVDLENGRTTSTKVIF